MIWPMTTHIQYSTWRRCSYSPATLPHDSRFCGYSVVADYPSPLVEQIRQIERQLKRVAK